MQSFCYFIRHFLGLCHIGSILSSSFYNFMKAWVGWASSLLGSLQVWPVKIPFAVYIWGVRSKQELFSVSTTPLKSPREYVTYNLSLVLSQLLSLRKGKLMNWSPPHQHSSSRNYQLSANQSKLSWWQCYISNGGAGIPFEAYISTMKKIREPRTMTKIQCRSRARLSI